MELFNYYRSSASWRVRIALALKGLPYDYRSIHLRKNEQLGPEFSALNPAHLVPLLRDGGASLTQSLAIIEYLDETHPEPPLLPPDAIGRARVRALALDIACEIHPLNNLRVLRYLVKQGGQSEEAKNHWVQHWIGLGFELVEAKLRDRGAHFCDGTAPGLADCLLVPQVYNAQRFDCDLSAFPNILRVNENCLAHEAFARSHPSLCPDAE
ncbi:MAG TPA: maleylacetoacetate isomerase [Burkholderiaceae bacterium]